MAAIATERLRLETLGPQHAHSVLAYYERNAAHLAPWEPRRPAQFSTLAYHADDCERSAAASLRGEYVRFAAFERSGEELVGLFNLWNIRRGVIHAAILGYAVDAAYEGRGFATEGARAVVAYAFETLHLHRIESSYQPANERSRRVLRKLGFVVEGYARDYLYLNGTWRDGILAALTNPSWRPVSQ